MLRCPCAISDSNLFFPVIAPFPSLLIHVFPFCPHLFHYTAPHLSYPSLLSLRLYSIFFLRHCSLMTSLLFSTHSPPNQHCNEDPYWIIVFAICLWVDSVIGFIHLGLCKPDPANPAFAFPQRILDDLSIK